MAADWNRPGVWRTYLGVEKALCESVCVRRAGGCKLYEAVFKVECLETSSDNLVECARISFCRLLWNYVFVSVGVRV